jgi:hypothetical protein
MKVKDAEGKWINAGFAIPLQSPSLPGAGNKISNQSIAPGTRSDCATTVMTVN